MAQPHTRQPTRSSYCARSRVRSLPLRSILENGAFIGLWSGSRQREQTPNSGASTERPRVMTMADLTNPNPPGLKYTTAELETIGKRALQLTNEYRRSKGLHALEWSSAIASIAVVHSKSTITFLCLSRVSASIVVADQRCCAPCRHGRRPRGIRA